MIICIYLKASSWELGLIESTQLGKSVAVYFSLCVLFAACACLSGVCYKIKLYNQRKIRKKKKNTVVANNRTELMKKVKEPTFGANSKDENTA